MKQALRKNFLGIDVSKPRFDVSLMPVIDHVKQPIFTQRFDNTTSGMSAFKSWLKTSAVTLDSNSIDAEARDDVRRHLGGERHCAKDH